MSHYKEGHYFKKGREKKETVQKFLIFSYFPPIFLKRNKLIILGSSSEMKK